MALRAKELYWVKTVDKNGKVLQDDEASYVYAHLPRPMIVGQPLTYTVVVEYLGQKQYKKSLAQRQKEYDKRHERMKKRAAQRAKEELERKEKQLVQRRKRIMNQIELAFVKKGKDAVNFVTCDHCDAMATHLGLAYGNPGSQVVDPDQITGAWCEEHDNKHQRPFKTKDTIACELLEFFYDGLRQIYVKSVAA
jgi:hypothetical protein